MPNKFEEYSPQDNIPETSETAERKMELPEGNETREIIENDVDVDVTEIEWRDQEQLAATREVLKSTEESRDWILTRKPREQWYQQHEVTTDSPGDKLRRFIRSLSKTERAGRRANEQLQNDFNAERTRYPEVEFNYEKGAGVQGVVGGKVGILAKGFGECSGLVLQTKDAAAVVHISPNTLRSTFEGGERVKDDDVWGHVRSALKGVLCNNGDGVAKRTMNKTDLSPEEISELQVMINSGNLTATMLSGEDRFVPHEVLTMFGPSSRFSNLPFMKVDTHYVGALGGGGGYAIYASPDNMYYIGSNGKMMKKGVNLPPTMYEYKKKDKK